MSQINSETRVGDIMIRNVHTVSRSTSTMEAAGLLAQHNIRHLVVVDGTGKTVGVLSERNLTHQISSCLIRGRDPGSAPIEEIMIKSPFTVGAETPLTEAIGILSHEKIGCLPVVNDDMFLVGIITVIDILQQVDTLMDRSGDAENTPDKTQIKNKADLKRHLFDLDVTKEVYSLHAQQLGELKQELENIKQQAAESARIKGEFLSDMSYEVRSSLTTILGVTESLLEPDLSRKERCSAVHAIKFNTEQLLEIINEILDLSQVEVGQVDVDHNRISVHELVAEVKYQLQASADSKNLVFDVEFINQIPQTIETDANRLRQILINLVENAITLTDEGGVQIITQFLPNDRLPLLQIEIIDTGIPLETSDSSRPVLEVHQPESSHVYSILEMGLKLAIARRFANLLGGWLFVGHQADQGNTVRLTVPVGSVEGIPLIDLPNVPTNASKEEAGICGPPITPESLLNCHVLLVEDSIVIRKLISLFLKKAGAKVSNAANGEKAIQLVQQAESEGKPFDVILMDLQIPILNGLSATKMLREQGYSRSIIALTAHAMKGDKEKCLEAGCDSYLTKPIQKNKLINTIRDVVNRAAIKKPQIPENAQA
ncbi:MAG: response regulator [Planctomycetes bacterium]|nr:response regulator [Planctomycetota bacterium]